MLAPLMNAAATRLAVRTDVETAKRLYDERHARHKLFEADLFGEAAWDILLDLYIQSAQGIAVSISSACVGANAAPTTALRWMRELERRGMVIRNLDPKDGRRKYVRLSDSATAAMRRYLDSVAEGMSAAAIRGLM